MHAKKESGEDLEITQTGVYSVCTEYNQPQGEDVNPHSEEKGANIGFMSDQETPRTLRRGGSMASIDPKKMLIGKPWSTGLFDCHENHTNAVMTAFLPCLTFGQIAEVVDGGQIGCHWGFLIYLLMMPALCSQWYMGSLYGTKLRRKFGLVEAPYTDVMSHIFCPICSLCQEFRELKLRELDPALGWKGILAQQQGEGEQFQDETLDLPPQIQAMSK